MLKKILLTIITFTLVFSFIKPVLAQSPGDVLKSIQEPSLDEINEFCEARKGDVMNLETWYSGKCKEDADMGTTTYTGEYRGFADIVILDFAERLGVGNNTKAAEQYFPDILQSNGLLPSIGKFQAMLLANPAASSIDYLSYVGRNIEKKQFVQPAYAQTTGLGFVALSPVLNIWKGFRNMVYLFFVLVFIAYGFMIMFRIKINPQTAVNIELAIPKIIGTLLMITFSYAIAGLLIDLSYLLAAVVTRSLQFSGAIDLRLLPDSLNLFGKSIDISFINNAIGSGDPTTSNAPINAINGRYLGIFGIGLFSLVRIIFGSAFSNILSLLIGLPSWAIAIVTTVTGIAILIKIILVIAVGYSMLKLLFELIKSYATVMMMIIFSPLILIGNIFPSGRDGSAFEKWIRNLFAHIVVFPATMILYMIAATLVSLNSPINSNQDIWTPPVFLGGGVGNAGFLGGVFSSNSARGASALLGFAILLIAPHFADIVRDAFKVKAFPYGKSVGEALNYGYGKATKELNNPNPNSVGYQMNELSKKLSPVGAIRDVGSKDQANWISKNLYTAPKTR